VLVQQTDIQRRFRALTPFLDERMRRLIAAAESEAIGYGGVSAVARATGVSRRAITEGTKELKQVKKARQGSPIQARIRRKGAGGNMARSSAMSERRRKRRQRARDCAAGVQANLR
jgi:hypothetical protein